MVANYLRSTELVSMDSTTIGPDLPYEVGIHCMVKMNEETVFIIGGSYFYYVSNRTTIVNPRDNFSMEFGPDLRIGRSYPACGIFEVNNKKIVAVTGGEVGPDENGSSTELWDPNSEDGWILGNFYCSKSKKNYMVLFHHFRSRFTTYFLYIWISGNISRWKGNPFDGLHCRPKWYL